MNYKQIIINEFGGPDVMRVVENETLPEPAAGEVRVKVLATSATFTDTLVRKGIYYGFKEPLPLSPGYDMVGVVDKLGAGISGTNIKVGQMVADLTVWGAYTEYMLRPVDSLVSVPPELDPGEAVSMILSYVTAYQLLHRAAKIKPGQRILVHGAGGAVGTSLLQLGRLLDLEVYGTASESKHALVESLGGIPIDYRNEDFLARMQAIGGVDAAFDFIGGNHFKRSFKSLRKGGILVPYGFYDNAMGKGGSVPIDYIKVALWNFLPNGRSTTFYSIADLRKKQPDWFSEDLTTLFGLLEEGKIKPAIERRMSLEDAVTAHKLIEDAAVKGRIVLEINK